MRHFQQQGDMQMEQEGARPNPDFLPFGAIIENWQAWAGMAAFLSWVNVMLCFEGALRDEVIYEGGLVHDPVFYGVTATAALAFIVLRSRKNHPKKSPKRNCSLLPLRSGLLDRALRPHWCTLPKSCHSPFPQHAAYASASASLQSPLHGASCSSRTT